MKKINFFLMLIMFFVSSYVAQSMSPYPPLRYPLDLCEAIRSRDFNQAYRLISIYSPTNLNNGNQENKTALHYAACFYAPEHSEQLVKRLLENGASADALDQDLKTPAHYAIEQGNFTLLILLVPEMRSFLAKDINGNSLMDLARKSSHQDILKYLECLYDENPPVELTGIFPYGFYSAKKEFAWFCCYAFCGRPWLVKRYISDNADLINDTSGEMLNPYDLEKNKRHYGNPTNICSLTPLHFACMARKNYVQDDVVREIILALIIKGANTTAQDSHGKTPWHYLAEKGRFTLMLDLYQSYNIPLNISDYDGKTPWDIAIALCTHGSRHPDERAYLP